jgi:hypothetical protein
VYFKSEEGKKNTAEALNSIRRFQRGKMEKDDAERDKLETEARLQEAEAALKRAELARSETPLAKEKEELELELLRQQVVTVRLENERRSLDLFVERKRVLEELVAKELLSRERFLLLVNGQRFLEKEGDKVVEGVGLEQVDGPPV